jgi:hypothetical protein
MELSKQDFYKCTIIRADEYKQKIAIRMGSFFFFQILPFCRDVVEEVLCIIRHSQYSCLIIYNIIDLYNMHHPQEP